MGYSFTQDFTNPFPSIRRKIKKVRKVCPNIREIGENYNPVSEKTYRITFSEGVKFEKIKNINFAKNLMD